MLHIGAFDTVFYTMPARIGAPPHLLGMRTQIESVRTGICVTLALIFAALQSEAPSSVVVAMARVDRFLVQVPEPGMLLLFGLGVGSLGLYMGRKREP